MHLMITFFQLVSFCFFSIYIFVVFLFACLFNYCCCGCYFLLFILLLLWLLLSVCFPFWNWNFSLDFAKKRENNFIIKIDWFFCSIESFNRFMTTFLFRIYSDSFSLGTFARQLLINDTPSKITKIQFTNRNSFFFRLQDEISGNNHVIAICT